MSLRVWVPIMLGMMKRVRFVCDTWPGWKSQAFIHVDTSRKEAKALQRNAAPIDAECNVGDLVIYRRDNVPGSTSTVWFGLQPCHRSRGREGVLAASIMRMYLSLLMPEKMRP